MISAYPTPVKMAAHAQTILEGTSAHALQTMVENAVN